MSTFRLETIPEANTSYGLCQVPKKMDFCEQRKWRLLPQLATTPCTSGPDFAVTDRWAKDPSRFSMTTPCLSQFFWKFLKYYTYPTLTWSSLPVFEWAVKMEHCKWTFLNYYYDHSRLNTVCVCVRARGKVARIKDNFCIHIECL